MDSAQKTTTRIKPALIGMTLSELESVAKEGGMPRFVAKQLAQWLYEKRVTSFDEMANISKKNKQWLDEYYVVGVEPSLRGRNCQISV